MAYKFNLTMDDLPNLLAYRRATLPINLSRRECVLIRDNFECQYCGKEIQEARDFEIDHVIPRSSGGADNYLNMESSCLSCNRRKRANTLSQTDMKLNQLPKPYHASKAAILLLTDEAIRRKWDRVFNA